MQEHPAVQSCCVIGLPDEDRGNIVHAIVEADPDGLDRRRAAGVRRRATGAYKLPRTVEFVDKPLRDDAGKVRRAALRKERLAEGSPP